MKSAIKNLWSKEEDEIFTNTVEKHGRAFDLLQKLLPTKTRKQIMGHGSLILTNIRNDPKHPKAHLRFYLEKRPVTIWSD